MKVTAEDAAFIDTTYLHGVKDFFHVRTIPQKLIWGIVLTFCAVALVLQLTDISKQFYRDNVGTLQNKYTPKLLPPASVCPMYNFFTKESGINDDLGRYLLGYFPMSKVKMDAEKAATYRDGALDTFGAPIKAEAEAMIAEYGHSLADLMTAKTLPLEQVMLSVGSFPDMDTTKAVIRNTYVNFAGLCYQARLTTEVNQQNAEFLLMSFRLKDDETVIGKDGGEEPLYVLYLGGPDTIAIQPQFTGRLEIYKYISYTVMVRVRRSERYRGRLGKYCYDKYEKSDYEHCIYSVANTDPRVCQSCKTVVPRSYAKAEKIYTTDPYCNRYDVGIPYCLLELGNVTAAQVNVNKKCKVPCIQHTYDYHVMENPSSSNTTGVTVQMDSLGFSTQIIEYPLVTLGDYLAAVGGTTGLYFGASVIAFFQIVFYLIQRSCKKKRVDQEVEGQDEKSRH